MNKKTTTQLNSDSANDPTNDSVQSESKNITSKTEATRNQATANQADGNLKADENPVNTVKDEKSSDDEKILNDDDVVRDARGEKVEKIQELVGKICIDQTKNKIKSGNGAKIETEKVHKKRRENDESVKVNLAKFRGEKHDGEKIVTTDKKTALDSRRTNFDYIKEEVVATLNKGALEAVKVLVEMLIDETATNSLKVDCAKEILNRVYGKTLERTNEACEIELSKQLKEYCE